MERKWKRFGCWCIFFAIRCAKPVINEQTEQSGNCDRVGWDIYASVNFGWLILGYENICLPNSASIQFESELVETVQKDGERLAPAAARPGGPAAAERKWK